MRTKGAQYVMLTRAIREAFAAIVPNIDQPHFERFRQIDDSFFAWQAPGRSSRSRLGFCWVLCCATGVRGNFGAGAGSSLIVAGGANSWPYTASVSAALLERPKRRLFRIASSNVSFSIRRAYTIRKVASAHKSWNTSLAGSTAMV